MCYVIKYTVSTKKTITLYTLPQLWQTTSDFNEIPHQHCDITLQTSHQISAKLVNICNSYSKFSKVTQEHKCPLLCKGVIDCQVCVHANGKTPAHLKSVLKMSTVRSNASSKTWTPLPDRFVDDHLVEMVPLFDQARLQLVDVTNLAAVHTLLQLPLNLVVDWVKVWTVGRPQS